MGRKPGSHLDAFGYSVRALECGQDALGARKLDHGIEGRRIVLRNVLGTARVVQRRVLGADRSVVESGGDGMGGGNLAVLVLEHIRIGALQYTGSAAAEACSMLAQRRTAAPRFDANEAHLP